MLRLVDAKIRASDKDLPLQGAFLKINDMTWFWTISISWFQWHDPEAGMNTNGMYALLFW